MICGIYWSFWVHCFPLNFAIKKPKIRNMPPKITADIEESKWNKCELSNPIDRPIIILINGIPYIRREIFIRETDSNRTVTRFPTFAFTGFIASTCMSLPMPIVLHLPLSALTFISAAFIVLTQAVWELIFVTKPSSTVKILTYHYYIIV